MKPLKNIYEKLITDREFMIINKAEVHRSMFRTKFDKKRIAFTWTPRMSEDKPGLCFCPYCGKIHIIYAPSKGVQDSHCYKEVFDEDGDYMLVRVGTNVPPEVERAEKAWSKILIRFIYRMRSGKFRRDKFSCLTALYYAGKERFNNSQKEAQDEK